MSAQLTDLQNSVNDLIRRLDDSELKNQITHVEPDELRQRGHRPIREARLLAFGVASANAQARPVPVEPIGNIQLDSGVTARAVRSKSRLRVKVTPSLPKGSWKFKVQKWRKGMWKAAKTGVRTRGKSETRTVNKPKGRYRVVVPASHGCAGSKSKPVRLRR